MRNHELNNIRIGNPDGLYREHQEPNRISLKNTRHRAIREDSSRAFREMIRVAEYKRRVKKSGKGRKKRSVARKASRGASMAGHALLIFTAVVFCAVVYVSSLTIRVRPCSSMATALAFQTYFRNPDETPLRATLYSEQESYDKDFVGVAYLLFEGLEKHTKYALSITNLETEEKIYFSTFLTAEEDPYRIQVENPIVTEEGVFEFSIAIGGLEKGQFYTVCVMDPNGKIISVTDHSDAQTSFSIPIKSLAAPLEEAEQSDATGKPSGGDAQPSDASGTHSGETAQTSDETEPQSDETAQPSDEMEPQSDETAQPSDEMEAQSDETAQPSDETEAQSDETAQPSGATGQPSGETDEQSAEAGKPSGDAAQQWDADSLPFVTVKINGKTFLPRVWRSDPETPEPVRESDAEAPDADEIEWIWNDDLTEAVAVAPDPEHPEETITLNAEVTEMVVKEADCTEAGLSVREANIPGENGAEYSDAQTVVIPPKGHSYERVRLDETKTGTSAEYVCDACGKTYHIDATFTEEPD